MCSSNYLASIHEPCDIRRRKRPAHRTERLHILRRADHLARHLHRWLVAGQLHHLHARLSDGGVKERRILRHLTVKLAGQFARHAAQRHRGAVAGGQLKRVRECIKMGGRINLRRLVVR